VYVIFRKVAAMGTIERDLVECCNGCDSNKVTERKVCIKHLLGGLKEAHF